MKKVVFGIWFILFFAICGQAADTYICPYIGTAHDELKRTDAVFIGQVIESKIVASSDNGEVKQITFRPMKVWRGVNGKEVVVLSAAYMPFKKGEKYLVFANYLRDNHILYSDDFCGRTKGLKVADKDLRELEEGENPLKLPDIKLIVRPMIPYQSSPSQ